MQSLGVVHHACTRTAMNASDTNVKGGRTFRALAGLLPFPRKGPGREVPRGVLARPNDPSVPMEGSRRQEARQTKRIAEPVGSRFNLLCSHLAHTRTRMRLARQNRKRNARGQTTACEVCTTNTSSRADQRRDNSCTWSTNGTRRFRCCHRRGR